MTTYPHEAVSTASPSYQNFSSSRERSSIETRWGPNLTFQLRVEQQPLKSRMSGVGEKNNRRPIGTSSMVPQTHRLDPPPAVSVTVLTNREDPNSFLGFPAYESMMLFLQVSLVHADHRPVVVVGRERQMSPIVGVTTSTMHRITLPNTPEWHRTSGQLTGVFAFTDLSIRQEGAYRLKFDLFELVNGEAVFRTLIYSDEFKVYPAKSFPGMAQSTDFTDVLKKHGIRVRVSKSVRNNGKKDAGNMGVGLPASKFHPDNGYMTQRGRHDHVNPRPTPYNPHSSRRYRTERERIAGWQFPHPSPPGQSLLPPPNHALPSPTGPGPMYDARPTYDTQPSRNDYNQGWSREPLHHFQPSYNSRPDMDTRSHGDSHNYSHREPASQNQVTLPIPSSALATNGFTGPGRFSSHTTRLPEMTPRRGSISHPEHSMRYAVTSNRHQPAETLPGNSHMGYNPIQESRQASRPERQNGNSYEEEQHWPPPATEFLTAPAQYGSSMGYQGYNR